MTNKTSLKLGLIGDNIAASRAPALHRLAGQLAGLNVTYDRLVPRDIGADFDHIFDACRDQGYDGLNITYPYKEVAAARVDIDDPLVRRMGAVNTVLFRNGAAVGLNTDHTGFVAAYQAHRPQLGPGVACLIGTGGVGRALAFGLVALKAQEIRLVDTDVAKAEALRSDLASVDAAPSVTVVETPEEAAKGADGILNATPVGMVGYEGTPLAMSEMRGSNWAFDAVYTPVETDFLRDAAETGLSTISGYELFIHQGLHAWRQFSGRDADEMNLRAALANKADAP